jgi:hypothetical protein
MLFLPKKKKKKYKTMKNKFLLILGFVLALICESFSNDVKTISFITTADTNYRNSVVRAQNTAYMNGLKVISKNTTKSGDIWVTVVKVTPRN